MRKTWFRMTGLLLCMLMLQAVSCETPTVSETDGETARRGERFLSVMTWNVQAVFDGEETGIEYDEYKKAAGWTEEKYLGRLNAIGQAIGEIENGAPDIIALEEIENAEALAALADGPLDEYGYAHTFFATLPGSSLGIGVLSRFELKEARAHAMYQNNEVTPRPVAEVRIAPQGKPMVLFVCHWKSKLGDDDATEAIRRQAARILVRRMREIWAEEPGMPVIVMGDLNENYDEFYRRNGEAVCALMPDDEAAVAAVASAAALTGGGGEQDDFIVISELKPPEPSAFPADTVCLYTPWAEIMESDEAGSYYYGDEWETIDHFLLSAALFDGAGWEYLSCERAAAEPFTGSTGHPRAYNPRTGSGLSDHLPLLLMLELAEL